MHKKTKVSTIFILIILSVASLYRLDKNQTIKYNEMASSFSPTASNAHYFSENFSSTTYLNETATNAFGWGLGNITLPEKNITLSRTNRTGWDFYISGELAYIGVGYQGIYVYNVSDSSNPILMGYNSTVLCGCLFVLNGYLFAGFQDYGLLVYDVHDSNNIHLVASMDDYNVDPWNDFVYAVDIWVLYENLWYIYVLDSDHGLVSFIFDEPDVLLQTGGYDPGGGNGESINVDVYSENILFIRGNFAYICWGYLEICDISDKSNPVFVKRIEPSDWASWNQLNYNVRGIYVIQDVAYLSVCRWSNEDQVNYYKLVMLNVSDPYNPELINISDYLSHQVYTIYALENLVFLGGSREIAEDLFEGIFIIFNVTDGNNMNMVYYYTCPFTVKVYYSSFWSGVRRMRIIENKAYLFDTNFTILDLDSISKYSLLATAQSIEIYSGSESFLYQATISVDFFTPSSTSVMFFLSCDNGSHWEQVYNDVNHLFTNTGDTLMWKIELSTNDETYSPIVYEIAISYQTRLKPPILYLPGNSETQSNNTPYFEWDDIFGAFHYIIQLDTSTNFNSVNFRNITTSNNFWTPSVPLAEGIWYWRVAGIDLDGDIGIFSGSRSLLIDAPPGQVILTSPDNNTYSNVSTPTFQWSETFDALNYTLQLDSLNTFSSEKLMVSDQILSTSYTTSSTIEDGKWYWRVQALDSSGNSGPFSSSFRFTIDTIIPSIDHPDDISYKEGTKSNEIIWNTNDINPENFKIYRNSKLIEHEDWRGGNITIDINNLPVGNYIYNCTVYDKAGNKNCDIVSVKVIPKEGFNYILMILSISGIGAIIGVSLVIVKKKFLK
ncbi:MAG: hypothetical protein ACFFDH_05575 [Promethearchaeota archaeon]